MGCTLSYACWFFRRLQYKNHEPPAKAGAADLLGQNLWTSPLFCSSCLDDGNIPLGGSPRFLPRMKPQFEKEQSAAGEFQRQEDAFRSVHFD